MKRMIILILILCQLPLAALGQENTRFGTFPRSKIEALSAEGYMAQRINSFLDTWVPVAVKENPELTQAIMRANPEYAFFPNLYSGLLMDQNTYFGQHLAGLAYCYRLNRNPLILEEGNHLVAELDRVRSKNGYLGVHATDQRLGAGNNWDVWGHYNAIWGLYQWYKLTGNETALKIAQDAAEYCIEHFKTHSYQTAVGCIRCSLGHAYALLYQETGNEVYLKEALCILEKIWTDNGNWMENALKGMNFYQSSQPRWESLHAIMLLHSLYEITGEQKYYSAIDQIWWSIIKTDRHNNGGFTTKETAVGSPFHNGAIETCANVAWMMFSIDYLRYSKNSYVADEIELTYFNAMLGSITENMRHVTYDNPMEGTIISSQESLAWIYNSGCPDYNCCQGNACQGMGQAVEWASMTDENALYLNFFAPCAMETYTPGGQKILLRITGDYPISGNIRITLEGLSSPEEFDLMVRIPVWSNETVLLLNDAAQNNVQPGQYYKINNTWKNEDEISLQFNMGLHYWRGENLYRKRTSIYWGPILLAQDEHYTGMPTNDVSFTIDAIREITIRPGDGIHQWLIAEAQCSTGETLSLIDYASAGKQENSYFTTWLQITPAPAKTTFNRNSLPLWTNPLP